MLLSFFLEGHNLKATATNTQLSHPSQTLGVLRKNTLWIGSRDEVTTCVVLLPPWDPRANSPPGFHWFGANEARNWILVLQKDDAKSWATCWVAAVFIYQTDAQGLLTGGCQSHNLTRKVLQCFQKIARPRLWHLKGKGILYRRSDLWEQPLVFLNPGN